MKEPQKIYSFTAQSNITVLTAAQLEDLLEERQKRGTNAKTLKVFEAWHRANLCAENHIEN